MQIILPEERNILRMQQIDRTETKTGYILCFDLVTIHNN